MLLLISFHSFGLFHELRPSGFPVAAAQVEPEPVVEMSEDWLDSLLNDWAESKSRARSVLHEYSFIRCHRPTRSIVKYDPFTVK